MASDKTPSKQQDNNDTLLKIDHQLCFALYSTSRAITKQYTLLLDGLGVTYPQYLVLLILWENNGLSIQQIAKALELESATTTPLIQRMEKLELLVRERSEEDERRVKVSLTTKAKRLKKKALDIPHQLGCALGLDQPSAEGLLEEMQAIKHYIKTPKDK